MYSILENLKQTVDARDLARELLGSGKRTGHAVQYPIDGQRTGSFTVYTNGYHDFSTGESGDIFALLVRLGAAGSRQAAIEQLRARSQGGTTAYARRASAQTEVSSDPPSAAWQTEMAAAVRKHHAYLLSDAPDAQRARAYLQGRGITDALIRQYQLGYNPRWHNTNYVLDENDADGGKRRVSIPPGMVIPWFADDALWAVHIRCRDTQLAAALGLSPDRDGKGDETAKYKFVIGSHIRGALFNGDRLHRAAPVLFVEGEFDAMIAGSLLDDVNVVTLGGAATHLAGRWRSRLTERAYVCLDNDAAGQNGAAALLKTLPSNTQRIELPAEKDVTDYHVSGGDLRAWWTSATASQQKTAEPPSPEPANIRFFSAGVPDSWRETLLKIDGGAALTYEILTEGLRRGWIDPDHITIAALLETVLALGWGVSPSAIQRGVKLLAGRLFSNLPTEKRSSATVRKFENNPKGGRAAAAWTLKPLPECRAALLHAVAPCLMQKAFPTQDRAYQRAIIAALSARAFADVGVDDAVVEQEVAALDSQFLVDTATRSATKRVHQQHRQIALQLNNPHSTSLALAGEAWKPRNARQYRVTYLRALKTVNPETYRSNREIADTLGLKSHKTAAAAVRGAGLLVHGDQFEERQLTVTVNMEAEVNRIARFDVKGKPRYIVAETSDGVLEVPYSAAELERQHQRSAIIKIKFQVANRHEVIADAQPIRPNQRTAYTASPRPPVRRADPAFTSVPTLGYTREWVSGQLILRLKRAGWTTHGDKLLNPETGEFVLMNASVVELLSALLGRPVQSVKEDGLPVSPQEREG